MTTPIDTANFFGIPVFEVSIPNFDQHQKNLIELFLEMRKNDPGIDRSNHGGWHSDDRLHEDPHPEIQWLASNLFKFSVTAIKHARKDQVEATISMYDMWVNINEAGNWNAPHIHLPRIWSGCVYIKVNENPKPSGKIAKEGDFIMFNPLPLGFEHNRQQTINYTPKAGTMLLFPSYMLHMVAPHSDEDPRISVAFNFNVDYKTQA